MSVTNPLVVAVSGSLLARIKGKDPEIVGVVLRLERDPIDMADPGRGLGLGLGGVSPSVDDSSVLLPKSNTSCAVGRLPSRLGGGHFCAVPSNRNSLRKVVAPALYGGGFGECCDDNAEREPDRLRILPIPGRDPPATDEK